MRVGLGCLCGSAYLGGAFLGSAFAGVPISDRSDESDKSDESDAALAVFSEAGVVRLVQDRYPPPVR